VVTICNHLIPLGSRELETKVSRKTTLIALDLLI
jgi:hypothetical protein